MTRNQATAPNAAYDWIDVFLDVTAVEVERNGARPTVISRHAFVMVASMYQAWSCYDQIASQIISESPRKRPAEERTPENQRIALSYAAFRALLNLYPDDTQQLREAMTSRGLDPDDNSNDPNSPVGVGNIAAAAIVDSRRDDGSNQYGDKPGATSPYSDYTNYQPANAVDKIADPDKWQPIEFTRADGSKFTPGYLTPHWGLVQPFALPTADAFRPGPPPLVGSAQLSAELQQVIVENANLTLEKKAIVEYMRDGPRSTSQPGQWLGLAQIVSRRDQHDLDSDVKMFFALVVAGLDAFIAAWETKRYYDSSRPWTLVRHYCGAGDLLGWAGPGQGTRRIPAQKWHPYSPANFVTPPFPGYVSGHSTVSGASARILEYFTGSDSFNHHVDWTVGSLTEEGFPVSHLQQFNGQFSETEAGGSIRLLLPTFSSVAEMAGISRIYGGFHIQADNIAGLVMGRQVANRVWAVVSRYFEGRA